MKRWMCEEKDGIRKMWIRKDLYGGFADPKLYGDRKQYKLLKIIDTGDYILIVDEKIQ